MALDTDQSMMVLVATVVAIIAGTITIVELNQDPVADAIEACKNFADTDSEQVCLQQIGTLNNE